VRESRVEGWARTGGMAAGAWPEVAVALLGFTALVFGLWPLTIVAVFVVGSRVDDFAILVSKAVGGLAGLVGLYSASTGDWWSGRYVYALTAAWFGLYGALWWRRAAQRHHHDRYLTPLHWALGFAFGLKAGDLQLLRPEDWLAGVKPELLDAEGGIMVRLPTPRVPKAEQRLEVERVLAEKLGLKSGEFKADWRLDADNRHLHVFRAPPPPRVPELVRFADVFDTVIKKAEPSFLPLAIGINGKVLGADVASQTPHLIINARTGWGKSSAVGLAIAHVLHHGGDVIIPDIKVISLDQFEGLDGVRYEDDIAGCHDVLCEVGELLEHRNREVKRRKRAGLPRMEFPRALVVVEEINALMRRLKTHWMEIRERGDRRPSPAITGYENGLLMGRAVNVNFIAITQSGSVNAVGGRDAREQYGTRILGWYTKNTWNMLVPEHPYVMATDRPGHGWLARGKNVWEAQFIYAEDDELTAYATSGARPANALAQLTQQNAGSRPGAAHDPGSVGSDPTDRALSLVPPVDGQDRVGPISLKDASDDQGIAGGIVSLTLNQLHNDRKRFRSTFPEALFRTSGGVDMYDPQDLINWDASRPTKRGRRGA
jgi:hypothetical protein